MKNIIGVLLLFGSSYWGLHAQNDELNQEKYWYLRQRLEERFVKVGPGHGESIPAMMYIIGADDRNTNTSTIRKKIDWGGDATCMLGWYIGVLATEIHLLEASGEDYSFTAEELWYALNAFDRLDDYAEIVWEYADYDGCDDEDITSYLSTTTPVSWDPVQKIWLPKSNSYWASQNCRNGFFLRMDGHPSLMDNFQDVDGINPVLSRLFNYTTGDWAVFSIMASPPNIDYRAVGFHKNNESSQDQVFNLLMGLMLVTKFVDASVYYNGESLKEKARAMALRILDWYDWWIIQNPVTGREPCSGGANSGAFVFSLLHLYEYFDHGAINNTNDQIYLWGSISDSCSGTEKHYQVNRHLYAIITALSNSTPHLDMCRYSDRDGFDWGFYYLLRKALYPHDDDNNPYTPLSECDYSAVEVQSDLNLCPCRGPYWDEYKYTLDGTYKENGVFTFNYGSPNDPQYKPDEWFLPNRYIKACSNNEARGEFNGLDYMLLFNLAKIVYQDAAINGQYTNMWHHNFAGPLNTGQSYTPVGFVDLQTDVQIPNTTRVEAKATHSINLLPGFSTENGAYFLGEIQDGVWTCDVNTYKSSGVRRSFQSNPHALEHNNMSDIQNDETPSSVLDNGITGIQETDSEQEIKIYPNPVTNGFFISCGGYSSLMVKITDLEGKDVFQKQAICGDKIYMTGLPSGVYHIMVSWSDITTQEFRQKHEMIIKTE